MKSRLTDTKFLRLSRHCDSVENLLKLMFTWFFYIRKGVLVRSGRGEGLAGVLVERGVAVMEAKDVAFL